MPARSKKVIAVYGISMLKTLVKFNLREKGIVRSRQFG
jgi:hypothetical protein